MTQERHNRPWLILVMEYAHDSTLHGIRFLAEPTKFLLRRFNNLTMGNYGHFVKQKQHWNFVVHLLLSQLWMQKRSRRCKRRIYCYYALTKAIFSNRTNVFMAVRVRYMLQRIISQLNRSGERNSTLGGLWSSGRSRSGGACTKHPSSLPRLKKATKKLYFGRRLHFDSCSVSYM